MEILKLAKFKAFSDELSIQLDNKNLLLYGENGAGKSSLYEAIKVVFFHQEITSAITSSTPEDQLQKRADYWEKYNNRVINQDFEIEINGSRYIDFDITDYQVYMISLEELKFDNVIYLKDVIQRFYFSDVDIDELVTAEFAILLQNEVNLRLKVFSESVEISIDTEDNFSLVITDSNKNISSKVDIKKFFNEAKVNLILLLVLLEVIQFSIRVGKKNILVLDDFITSLDASNRLFLIKHILESFQTTQILIFTHNISFFNLIMYMIKSYMNHTDKWVFANVYEINNIHKIYFKNLIEKVENINVDFAQLITPHSQNDIDSIGNRIRIKFEILLYEFSKLVMIGAVEDSNKIIDRILSSKAVYYKSKATASDLIDKIQMVLDHPNQYNLKGRLESKINEFKNDDFQNFRQIVRELKLYQKIALHPLSHGVAAGMPTFTITEISKSLDLLQKMEEYLKDMVDSNVNVV